MFVIVTLFLSRGGKSTDNLYLSRITDTSVKKQQNTPIKVPITRLYSSKSEKLQALKCTHIASKQGKEEGQSVIKQVGKRNSCNDSM